MMGGRLRAAYQKAIAVFRKRELDDELEAELTSHLELAIEENLRRGLSVEEAQRMAFIQMGGRERAKEEQRDARGVPWLETTLQDVRYGLRTLRRDAGFAVFAILIIGLGIGASSAVFGVLDTLLIKPLPFKDPGRLVWLANRPPTDGDLSGATLQVSLLQEFRERNKSFSDVAAYFAFYGVGDSKLTGSGEPERLSTVPVSQNFFALLGVQPQLGRLFSADECKWNGPHVVLLSDGLWKRRFGSDPNIAGRTIRLDDHDTTVVGVLPASFDFAAIFAPGTKIDLFSPFPLTKETDAWGNTLAVIGRLKPGVRIGQAQAEARVLGMQITKANPRKNGIDPELTLFATHVSARMRPALAVLVCAVGVVMLIVCVNLSNLLLARTATRQKEIALRLSLGAGRRRLIRQLLTESLLLTTAGALLGLAFTFVATRGLAHLSAFDIPLLSDVKVNLTVLGFVLVATVGTGLVLGLAPALQASALRLNASLKQRGTNEGKGHSMARAVLVVSEIAFACVLLVGAGLFVRSFLRVMEVDPGFRPESAAAWRVDPSQSYDTLAKKNAYFDDVLSRVRAIPGVQAAGLTDILPLGHNRSWGTGAKGVSYKPDQYPSAFVRVVSDGYLKAMGIRLKEGRDLNEHDVATAGKPVIMINQTLAHVLWPGANPIGQFVEADRERQVVGVVGDVRHIALEQTSGSEMYLPVRQCQDWGSLDLVVRSTLPLPVLSARVESALHPLIPDLPKASMRPLANLVDHAVSPRRFIVWLLTGFAVFALILACLGIYGVISYSVARRTQEIGIRMALGAQAGLIRGQIVLQTLRLAGIGLLIGAVVSWALAHVMTGLLFGVTANDPFTFVGAMAVMLMVALLAGYVPARGASNISPTVALRVD